MKVRQHAAALLVREHALPAHAAAVAARDLVLRALTADPQLCLAVVVDQVEDESGMLFTRRRLISATEEFTRVDHVEDKAGPACDMYLAVMEGDVRRTARMVLRLLGHELEIDITLGQLVQRLRSEASEPACSLLLGCVNTDWRNAIAHSQVRWDSKNQRMLLRGQPVEPDSVQRATVLAHNICADLETGVAVALNHAGNPHHEASRPATDPTAWESHFLRRLGTFGVEALRLRRMGTTIHLRIQPLTASKLREVLVGVFVAGFGLPDLDSWEIQQDNRPSILLDARTLHTAAEVVQPVATGRASVHPDAVALVLCAGGLTNHGDRPASVANTVVGLASAAVIGERDRLRSRLLGDDGVALAELLVTLRMVKRGVEAAASLTESHELIAFAAVLSVEHDRQIGRAVEIANGLEKIQSALHATTPIDLPWIVSTDDRGPQH